MSVKDVRAYACTACGTQVRIVGGIARQLQSLGIFVTAAVLMVAAKWAAYRVIPTSYAEIAWAVASIFILVGAIAAVAVSFEYEAQQGAPVGRAPLRGARR